MSGKLLGHIAGIDTAVTTFGNHVEVRSGTGTASLRYEEIRSVKLGKGLITNLVIKDQSGRVIKVAMWRDDALEARRCIEALRRKLKKLREVGFESLEDFEARSAELSKRLGIR